jgi:hypothetical protein
VNAEQQIRDWTIESIIYERFIETAKTTEATSRELLIQNSKLQRLLAKSRPRKYQLAAEALYGGLSKKERKRRGQATAKIGEQRRKVRKLLNQFVKEFLSIHAKKLPTRAAVRAAVGVLDKRVEELAQKMIADTSKIVAKFHNPFNRLGNP